MKKSKAKKPKKKTVNPAQGLEYTVVGEWFPEIYPALRSKKWSRGNEDPLRTEMRLFGAAERWAFNRLLEGRSREELKREGQGICGLNSRYTDDAIMKAQAVIDSQKELLPLEIEETEKKLVRAKKKLRWAEKDLDQGIKGNDPAKIEKAKRTLHGRQGRVKKLAKKLAQLKEHEANGTIPKVVFGGRSLWRQVARGKVSREKWRDARQNRLYARGDRTKAGNPNVKVSYSEGRFSLAVTISHLSKQDGKDKKGRPKMTRAPRVTGKLWLPKKHRSRVWKLLYSGAPYSLELIRGQDDRYRAHISFSLKTTDWVTNSSLGYLGLDTNPDGVALANVNYLGQPEPWPADFGVTYPRALHKFKGEFQVTVEPNGFLYIRIPELAYGGSFRRTYLSSVLAQVVVEMAKRLGKPLAVEDLDFGKDRLDTDRRFNRMASNFPYEKITEAIVRKAYKEGVGVKTVWPAHTSTIGCWKYQKRYGITVHHAAALTIARRALGLKERITKELKQKIQVRREKLNQKVRSLPGEGKGMTRKVKRFFGRLGEKVSLHNGLDRYKQESFHSAWSDLKELVLLSR
ncbi:MAG: IS200/IS605 family accessory protein TnpB-related protein [Firmicutes bacterium]|nr:IS200/IS605 family accessory protein TnpB-related protein [Bacillota bacterium]